jgi:hypothetical protein
VAARDRCDGRRIVLYEVTDAGTKFSYRHGRGDPIRWIKPTRPERFELPTFGSVDRRSIQLSYGRWRADSRGGLEAVRGPERDGVFGVVEAGHGETDEHRDVDREHDQ